MNKEETIEALRELKDTIQEYTKDEIDDPEEIEMQIVCNADLYIEALSAAINVLED